MVINFNEFSILCIAYVFNIKHIFYENDFSHIINSKTVSIFDKN